MNILSSLKNRFVKVITHRLFAFFIIGCCLISILIYRLFTLQIIEGQEHLDNFIYKIQKEISVESPRGEIYDRNGVLLAYNKLIYKVTFENTTQLATNAKKHNVSENTEKNEVIYKLITVLEKYNDSIDTDFPIILTSKGKFKFTLKDNSLLRFKKEVYSVTSIDKLSDKQKNATALDVFNYLRHGSTGSSMFDISDEYDDETALKIMAIRYELYLNRYTQYVPIQIALDVCDESIAEISERSDEFPGVKVETDSIRVYNEAIYMANIIGYTGVVSTDEMTSLNKNIEEDEDEYVGTDIVGKIGIEKELESVLRGKKGTETIFVDNLGKILEICDKTEATPGNDVYLTIDVELQKNCYNILERNIAGILLKNIETGDEKEIPITDVYFALINNNIVDINVLNDSNSTENEKEIYNIFLYKQSSTIQKILDRIKNESSAALQYENEEYGDYLSYIYKMLKNNNVLNSSAIPTNDEVYTNFINDKINLHEFLEYCIMNNWIDISQFNISKDYYDTDAIFDELLNYISEVLLDDTDFDKLLYKYLIEDNSISGKQVCMLLFDQGVLNKETDEEYEDFILGKMSAYDFIRKKIENIEITPAQLALDPCSGSVVITDVDTGEVLALVSYPSYDNNRLANTIDSEYYAQLINDSTRPMYNRATRQRTAPGSTFKLVSTVAGVSENVIGLNDYVYCSGKFDRFDPAPKCWRTWGHGSLKAEEAIMESCNIFFYEIGYRLSLDSNKNYSANVGLEKIKNYASMFGFNEKSGIELPETEPHISDEDPVRSAIGQGTHNYTPSQIARYVTALANSGTVYNLSIIDKILDSSGNVIEDRTPTVYNKIELDTSLWDTIHNGMRRVVTSHTSIFGDIDNELHISGKTGTAEENKKRANHALFTSYAPSEDPQISVTTVIPFGYSSSNAATTAKEIYRYYFGIETNQTEGAITSSNDTIGD